jgi:hypothetical protein
MNYTIILRDTDGYTTVFRKENLYLEFVPDNATYQGCVYKYVKTIGDRELIYDFDSSYLELY